MKEISFLSYVLARSRKSLGLFLVLAVLLTQIVAARAGQLSSAEKAAQIPDSPGSGLSVSAGPVAVDDGGEFFTTGEDHAFYTGSVLANDKPQGSKDLFLSGLDTAGMRGLLVRKDGLPDQGFGEEGKVLARIRADNQGGDVIFQADGKIILVGSTSSAAAEAGFAVLRFNLDGSLDPSFSGDGVVTTDFGSASQALAVALQPDQKIVVAGKVGQSDIAMARYNPDGSLDLTFDSDGKVTTTGTNLDSGSLGFALQEDGKMVLVGTALESGAGSKILIARFNPDGSPDLTFDGDGILTFGITDHTLGYGLAIQPDNKILISTYAAMTGTQEGGCVLVRLDPDGSLDGTFGDEGIVCNTENPIFKARIGKAVALQPDGKIVITGNAGDRLVLARFNADGSPDPTFGNGGIVLSNYFWSYGIALLPNGKILVSGTGGIFSQDYTLGAIRFHPDGRPDLTFGVDGEVDAGFEEPAGGRISVGSSGKVAIAGNSGTSFALAQILSEGAFFYDPDGQFEDLNEGEQATDTFTYTLSDGNLTDSATVTITILGAAERTYLPFIKRPVKGIFGLVTDDERPASRVPLILRFFDGSGWKDLATTATGTDGSYQFGDVPSLADGQAYDVLYQNPGDDPTRLGLWRTREITSFNRALSVNMGSFDISNVELRQPRNGAGEVGPVTFLWTARKSTFGDSYSFNLFDPANPNRNYSTEPPLGYVETFTLAEPPRNFIYGKSYQWRIWVHSPDGGSGASFEARSVSFKPE
jgi:uncharacterized delta-60 repeat protein